jgi:hypothetical protein
VYNRIKLNALLQRQNVERGVSAPPERLSRQELKKNILQLFIINGRKVSRLSYMSPQGGRAGNIS